MLNTVLLAMFLVSQLQQPSPTPAKSAEEKQNQPSTSQTATQNSQQEPQPAPSEISNNPGGPQAKPADQQAGNSNDQASANWWIVIFTGLLTLITLLQWITAYLQRRTLISVERAYLHIADVTIADLEVGKQPMIKFSVWNTGHTPARLVSVAGWPAVSQNEPGRPGNLTVALANQFIGAAKAINIPIQVMKIETADLLEIVKNGGFWIFIELRYQAQGIWRERVYRCCWQFSRTFQDMRLSNTSQYQSDN